MNLKQVSAILVLVLVSMQGFSQNVCFSETDFYTNQWTGKTSIAAGDFNNDGKQDIVQNSVVGSQSSLNLLLGNGTPLLAVSARLLANEALVSSIVAVDINNDGNQDIALGYYDKIRFLLGDGTASFPTMVDVPSGYISDLGAADFDNDGIEDIVGKVGGGLSIILGRTDGTLALIHYTVSWYTGDHLTIADFNNDGNKDVLFPGDTYLTPGFFMWLGNGNGTFTTTTPVKVAPENSGDIISGDFDGDGSADVAMTDALRDRVYFWRGKGTGNFYDPWEVAMSDPEFLAVADLNNDGKQEVISSSPTNKNYGLVFPFGGSSILKDAIGTIPSEIVGVKVNSDNNTDFVSANYNGQNLTVSLAFGSTLYTSIIEIDGPVPVALSAFTNLIATANTDGTASIGYYSSYTPTYPAGTDPTDIVFADFNSDGKGDVVVTNGGSNDISVILAKPTSGYLPTENFALGFSPKSLVSADFNADGKPDLATSNATNVSILIGDGAGVFALTTLEGFTAPLNKISAADMNMDGHQDIVVSYTYGLFLALGDGTGSFAAPTQITLPQITSFTIADFNGDTKPDVALGYTSSSVGLMLGNGDGSFGSPISSALSSNTKTSMVAFDFNYDGNMDLAVTDGRGNLLNILNGDGAGQVVFDHAFTTGGYPNDITLAITNSNDVDVVTNNSTTASITKFNNITAVIKAAGPTTFCQGNSVVLLNQISNTGTYSWFKNDLFTSGDYKQYTASVSGDFRFTVRDSKNQCVSFSEEITVNVQATTSISTHPSTAPQTLCRHATATQLSVTAAGNSLDYQWYWSPTNPNPTWTAVTTNGTASTLTPSTTTPGTFYYRVVVTGSCGVATSNVSGKIVVNDDPVFTVQPSNSAATICQGGSAPALNVAATDVGTITYQWYYNPTKSYINPQLVTNASATTHTPQPPGTGTFYYFCKATGTCGYTWSSFSGAITVNPNTTISVHPSSAGQTLCPNGATNTLRVTAAGVNLSYQWWGTTSNNNTSGGPISGATLSYYDPPSSAVGTKYYYCVVSGGCGPAISSGVSGALVINPPTVITTHPSASAQTVCLNAAPTPLSVAGTGAGTLVYKWYWNSTGGTTGTLITGATSSSYTPPTTSNGTRYYYATITGTCGIAKSSTSGGVTVVSKPTISSHPSTLSQSICQGVVGKVLTVSATGSGTLSYQWFQNTVSNNFSGSLIGGATSSSYTTFSNTAGTYYYYCNVTASCGTTVSNVSAATTVKPKPVITAFSGASIVCPGNTYPYSVSVSGTVTFAWTNPVGWIVTAGSKTSSAVTFRLPVSGTNYGTVGVTVTGSNGCAAIDGRTVYPQNCGSSFASASSAIFPNPSDRELTIELSSGLEKDVPIKIYSLQGKLMRAGFGGRGSRTHYVDTSELIDGYYIVEIGYPSGPERLKLLVQHKN